MTQFLDLENGYLVMGAGRSDQNNCWQTGIECILARFVGQDEKQYAHLSHECRSENVSVNIFDHQNYEFVVVKGWNKNINLRSGSYNYGFNPLRNFFAKAPETVYEISDIGVEAYCKSKPVTVLSFGDALELFQKKGEGKSNKIYMRIEYEKGSKKYELFAPCRYTNFPKSLEGEKYLQPISGYVLFEDQEKFHLSYVAAHIREDGTKAVEFRIREMTSFINTKNKASLLYPFFRLLDFLLLRFFFVTDDFSRIEKFPNAKCTLFTYDD